MNLPYFYSLFSICLAFAQGGWIDEDTPEDKRTITSLIDGSEYKLVMSDEFNTPGRTFKDGDDATWTALDKSDDDSSSGGGGSLVFYNSSLASTTKDGYLELRSTIQKTEWEHYEITKKEYRKITRHFGSAMMQSWNKFCFTGGIVEVDIILPGDPYIGGLWPAVWLLGNLGRATYEASTNNIWPWSYDTCDRKMQEAQKLSACNSQNHFGLNSFQGRGATEIDIIEVMTGDKDASLDATDPRVSYPYADFTLQVAPGVKDNRPQSGSLPIRHDTVSDSGFTEWLGQSWYEGLETNGNTTLNPYFYGTYLGLTHPGEPVQRNKNQVFQADAVGAMHQLTSSHFKRMHTFRLEWQPGPGGRLDWFTKDYKVNSTFSKTGDGRGQDWVRAFTIKDDSLNLTGAHIPIEPSYLIMNTGISSTWGFPYNIPDSCPFCHDCNNATCACSFQPGFCNMMKESRVAMYIDHVRVYQTTNHSAHVGHPHSLGCDPVQYPSKEWIKGHEDVYMRQLPFSINDLGPLKKKIRVGGGNCKTDADCGGRENSSTKNGICILDDGSKTFFSPATTKCKCNRGYVGPFCLSQDKKDDQLGASELHANTKLFDSLPGPALPTTLIISLIIMISLFFIATIRFASSRKRFVDYRLLSNGH